MIHELLDEKAYLQARIEYFDDIIETVQDDMRVLALKGLSLLEQLDKLTYVEERRSEVDIEDFKGISFLIAGCEGFTHEEKQKFLEMTSTHERLDKSVASLENIIQRLKLTVKIKKIISTCTQNYMTVNMIQITEPWYGCYEFSFRNVLSIFLAQHDNTPDTHLIVFPVSTW